MVVGITGSIACGKSLVSSYLKNKNYVVIDSDIISHEVLLLEEVKTNKKQAPVPEWYSEDEKNFQEEENKSSAQNE